MPPLDIVVWVVGAIGLGGVAWAFFKSNSFAVRIGALGVFGVFYISVLAFGWGGVEWFNATTIAIVLIALLSNMKAPLSAKTATAAQSPEASEPDALDGSVDAEPKVVPDASVELADGADVAPETTSSERPQ